MGLTKLIKPVKTTKYDYFVKLNSVRLYLNEYKILLK
jgi:hypothetical protein